MHPLRLLKKPFDVHILVVSSLLQWPLVLQLNGQVQEAYLVPQYLTQQQETHREFMIQIMRAEEELIRAVNQSRTKMLNDMSVGIEQEYRQIVYRLYTEKDAKGFTPRLAGQLWKAVKSLKQTQLDTWKSCSQSYRQQINKKVKQIQNIKETTLSLFTEGLNPPPEHYIAKTDSRILSTLSYRKREEAGRFLARCLQSLNVSSIRLLFRASEHRFNGVKFEQCCKNVPHTIVLIRSSTGKILGGYTPKKWYQSRVGEHFQADAAGGSFLFSIDSLEKFALRDKNCSILHRPKKGPAFGKGDLAINDNSQYSAICTSTFPTSYEKYGEFANKSGHFGGSQFQAVEYEVFAVESEESECSVM